MALGLAQGIGKINDAECFGPLGVEADVSCVESLSGDNARSVQLFYDRVESGYLSIHGVHALGESASVKSCNTSFGSPECGSLLSPHIALVGNGKNDIDCLHCAEVIFAVPGSLG